MRRRARAVNEIAPNSTRTVTISVARSGAGPDVCERRASRTGRAAPGAAARVSGTGWAASSAQSRAGLARAEGLFGLPLLFQRCFLSFTFFSSLPRRFLG